jgi:hypothetical protein
MNSVWKNGRNHLVAETLVNGKVLSIDGEDTAVWREFAHSYQTSIGQIHARIMGEQAVDMFNLLLHLEVRHL